MALKIGLNVLEVDGVGAPAIVGAAVSVAAFNIQTRRGRPNQPVRVTSFPQFVEQFGGLTRASLGGYLVKGFFDNGGQTAYVNRVTAADPATGDAPAAIVLDDGANRDTLRLEGGWRGRPDPGAWGNDLYARVDPSSTTSSRLRETAPATTQGTALAAQVNMVNAPALSVLVDGDATATQVAFQASDFGNAAQATREEIRDAINRRTTNVIASLSNDDRLVLTSSGQRAAINRQGTSLQVNAASAPLGLAVMAQPVRGTLAALTQGGTQLANAESFTAGDAILLADGSRTALAKLTSVTPASGAVTWAPNVSNVGSFDDQLLQVSDVRFDLTLALGGTEPDNQVEAWTGLSMEPDVPSYAPRVLNDALRGSRYVVATDQNSVSTVGQDVPRLLPFTRFAGGRDGTATANDFVGDQAERTGFYSFDPYDVQLVGTERTDAAIVRAALDYCASRGDCMFVGSLPEGFSASADVVGYGQAFQGKNVYGAFYHPWIKVFDPLGAGAAPIKSIPPTGHVMGVYARVESSRGIWKAPAGDEANVAGALDVEYRLSDAEHTDWVKNGSVNGIRVVPGAGIVVDASRTLSTDTRWMYVNVRLLFNYVKSSLKKGLRWVRQEPNKDTLWNAVKFSSVTPFLLGLWRQGAFGTGQPAEVFTVICDATNNPPDEVDKGNFKVEVYFYPSKPAETILIVVGQQPSGAQAAEA